MDKKKKIALCKQKDKKNILFMVNKKFKTREEKINKTLSSNSRTKLKIHQNSSKCYHQMNNMRQTNVFQFEEDHFSKGAQGRALLMHEALSLRKFFQTKHQVKNRNINYYDLYNAIILYLSDERRGNWDLR